MVYGAHGVVVSHPLLMRKALGSNPSVSRLLQQWAQLGNIWHMGSGQAHLGVYPPWRRPKTPPTAVFQDLCRRMFYGAHGVVAHVLWGTWCSGITYAPHAEGPGCKSQCAQTSAAVGAAGQHLAHGQWPGPPRCLPTMDTPEDPTNCCLCKTCAGAFSVGHMA